MLSDARLAAVGDDDLRMAHLLRRPKEYLLDHASLTRQLRRLGKSVKEAETELVSRVEQRSAQMLAGSAAAALAASADVRADVEELGSWTPTVTSPLEDMRAARADFEDAVRSAIAERQDGFSARLAASAVDVMGKADGRAAELKRMRAEAAAAAAEARFTHARELARIQAMQSTATASDGRLSASRDDARGRLEVQLEGVRESQAKARARADVYCDGQSAHRRAIEALMRRHRDHALKDIDAADGTRQPRASAQAGLRAQAAELLAASEVAQAQADGTRARASVAVLERQRTAIEELSVRTAEATATRARLAATVQKREERAEALDTEVSGLRQRLERLTVTATLQGSLAGLPKTPAHYAPAATTAVSPSGSGNADSPGANEKVDSPDVSPVMMF